MPIINNKMKRKLNIQLIVATVVTLAGIILLFMGFWVNPMGVIDNSVLVAFGEALSLAGALLGIGYTYRYRGFKYINLKNKNNVKAPDGLEII